MGNSTIINGTGVIYSDSDIHEFNNINWYSVRTSFLLNSSLEIPQTEDFPIEFPDISLFDELNLWKFSNYLVKPTVPNAREGIFIEGRLTSVEVIPEPCSVLLVGLGGLAVMRRRRLR